MRNLSGNICVDYNHRLFYTFVINFLLIKGLYIIKYTILNGMYQHKLS